MVIIYGGYSAVCFRCYFFFLEIPQSKSNTAFRCKVFRRAKITLLIAVGHSARQKLYYLHQVFIPVGYSSVFALLFFLYQKENP